MNSQWVCMCGQGYPCEHDPPPAGTRLCHFCNGKGWDQDDETILQDCPVCHGTGLDTCVQRHGEWCQNRDCISGCYKKAMGYLRVAQPESREIPRSEEYEEWRSKWRDFYERHRGEKWLTEEQFYAEAYQEGYEEGFERGFQRAATRAAPPSEGKAPSND